MDDFSNDRSTTGNLTIDTPISGDLEVTGDVDWFHADLVGWVEIRIEALDSGFGTLENPVLKSIFAPNDDGRQVQFVDRDSGVGRDATLRVLVDNTDLYLAVAGIGGLTGTYRIIAEQFADHADTFGEVPSSILLNQATTSLFDNSTDRDIFRTQALRFNRHYEINVSVGQYFPGGDNWRVSIYDQNQVLQHQIQEDSPEISFVFNPATDGQYFVTVDSLGNTGDYDLEIKPIDDQATNCNGQTCGGQGNRAPLPPSGASVYGDIEIWTDIDRFGATAWSGGYYVLTFGPRQEVNNIGLDDYVIHFEQSTAIDTHTLVFTGSTTQKFEVIPELDADFDIDVSSGSFVDGKYEISLEETPPIVIKPTGDNGLMFLPVEGQDATRLDSLIDQTGVLGNEPDTWQFWHQPGNAALADVGYLTENGTVRPSNEIYTVPADEFGNWQIHPRDSTFNSISGTDEIFVRAAYKGIYTPWVRLRPQIETIDPGTQDGTTWSNDVITFSFMEELPEYLGSFGGFTALSESYKEMVRTAMTEWDKVGAFQLVESSDHESVDIRVGAASFAEAAYTHSAPPGTLGISGDILLNSARYDVEFAPGDVLFQRLMRAVGISLGLSDIPDGTITVADSILRTYSVDGIFPYQPMRLDQLFLREKYGLDTTTNAGDNRYLLQPGAIELNSLFDAGGYDTIDAGLFDEPVRISIHQGGQISTPDGKMWVGYGSEIERVNGGRGNDYLGGNELDNKVTGRAGNDFVYGMQGNDVLLGGQGNDRYGYRLGDGYDLINEQGHGGRDVLHIQTPLSLGDSFIGYENIRFMRDGNDLVLDFTHSPHRTINDPVQLGPSEGSIRIRNMNNPNSAVEVLRLDDGHHNLYTPVISLVSIYSRMIDGQSSFFQFSDTYDQWGVVPEFAFPS